MERDRPDDAVTLDRDPNDALLKHEARVHAPLVGPRYETLALLGEGGMGEVHRARDSIATREVALKIIHREQEADNVDRERFLREACVQAQLEHPGIVAVYDLDRTRREFFTMRIVEGITLAEVIHRLAMGDAEATREFTRHRLLTAFLQVCRTIDYAHARGVLHRDIKPSNVMLGSFGEVYVLDWGLAKPKSLVEATNEERPASARMTAAGIAMGTRGYMSPEQARGRPIDERADVFALGATLFELLALEPLFDEAQAKRLGRELLTYDAAPSSRGKETPRELDEICVKATAHDKSERFASVRELHDALEVFHSADRDLADRRRLAEKHLQTARASADRALASDDEAAREEALGELGRTLALAPNDEAGRRLFVELLTTPPRKIPGAVQAAQRKANQARLRQMQGPAALTYALTWVVLFPVLITWAGVERVLDVLIPALAWVIASLTIVVIRRYRIYETPINYSNLTVMFAVATTSFLAGPYFLVPALATATLMGHLLVATRRQRPSSVFVACLAVVLPAIASWTGIHPIATLVPEGIVVHAAVQHQSETIATVAFTVVHVFAITAAGVFAVRFRRLLDRSVTKNALFAWQLGKLVPRRGAEERALTATSESGAHDLEGTPILELHPVAFEENRYERVRRLSSGSETESWSCRDRRLGREIALTFFTGEKGSAAEASFLARAIVNAKIEHPAIVPVYDVGKDEAGRAFFTMKLVRGESLEAILEGKKHSLHRLLGAMSQACLAVAHAHARGVPHGNLTPSVILLGSFGEIYVTGWGEPASGVTVEGDVPALANVLAAILRAHPEQAPELEAQRSFTSARDLSAAIEGYLAGDRDAELRERLAVTHRERAHAATTGALSGDDGRRVEALREVGSAIALAPNDASFRLLLSLLTTPPKEPPPEVQKRIEELRIERARRGAKVASFFIGGVTLLFPILANLIGVRNMNATVLVASALVLAEIALVASVFRPQTIPWAMFAMTMATGVASLLGGPFLVIPGLAVICVISFALIVVRRWIWVTMGCAIASVLVPTLLQAFHVYAFYEFIEHTIAIHGALEPEPRSAFLLLTFLHLVTVLFAADYSSRFRDTLDAAETESLFATWQLSKIVGQK